MKTQLVKNWMTPNPICAPSTLSLPEAHELMKNNRIRRLPVVENDKLVGIVTRGDLRGAQPSEATSLSIFELHYLVGRITLKQLLTPNPLTITPDASVYDAAKVMLRNKIAGLPVVDAAGKVVGIITESDIFRLVVKLMEDEA